MQVVLKKRVPKLGNEHDVVKVKPGFARNFLFPQKLALPATEAEIKRAETLKAQRVEKVEALLENAKEVADKLKSVTLTFKKKARGEKLYGSIKEKDIADALAEQAKVEVKKEMVKMDDHLKTLGEHTVKLQLTEDIEAKVKVMVESE
ncbi:50S ribosomal protein L9 [Candidatus Peregrinibacteria bacterium]|nr:50S ribosomal protein L9 [Candidatus Peregrinibacteria bacterium]